MIFRLVWKRSIFQLNQCILLEKFCRMEFPRWYNSSLFSIFLQIYQIGLLLFLYNNYSIKHYINSHPYMHILFCFVLFCFVFLIRFVILICYFISLVRHGDQRVIIFLSPLHIRRANWYNSILSRVVWQTFQIWYYQQHHNLFYHKNLFPDSFDHRIIVNVFCFKERIEYWSYTTEEKTFESWNGISFKYSHAFLFGNNLFWQEFLFVFCLNFQIPHIYINDNWPIKVRIYHMLSSIFTIIIETPFLIHILIVVMIKYVSMSYDGTNIAVSGKRGFTIYNSTTKRWQLCGDVKEVQSTHFFHLSCFECR
jgi:hypothetical protein